MAECRTGQEFALFGVLGSVARSELVVDGRNHRGRSAGRREGGAELISLHVAQPRVAVWDRIEIFHQLIEVTQGVLFLTLDRRGFDFFGIEFERIEHGQSHVDATRQAFSDAGDGIAQRGELRVGQGLVHRLDLALELFEQLALAGGVQLVVRIELGDQPGKVLTPLFPGAVQDRERICSQVGGDFFGKNPLQSLLAARRGLQGTCFREGRGNDRTGCRDDNSCRQKPNAVRPPEYSMPPCRSNSVELHRSCTPSVMMEPASVGHRARDPEQAGPQSAYVRTCRGSCVESYRHFFRGPVLSPRTK